MESKRISHRVKHQIKKVAKHPRNLTAKELMRLVWVGVGIFAASIVLMFITFMTLYSLPGKATAGRDVSVTWQFASSRIAQIGMIFGVTLAVAAGIATAFQHNGKRHDRDH